MARLPDRATDVNTLGGVNLYQSDETDTPIYEPKPINERTPARRLEKGSVALKRAGDFWKQPIGLQQWVCWFL